MRRFGKGKWFYRVRAKNAAGVPRPSNVSGPVAVSQVTFVDELADFSKVHSRSGELEIKSRDCRSALEDAHRAAGQAGSTLVYRIGSPIAKARVFVFFPKDISDLKISLSADGQAFRPVAAQRKDFLTASNDYSYWRRAIYEVTSAQAADRFVKIEFTGEAQIGRVEIQHAADPR